MARGKDSPLHSLVYGASILIMDEVVSNLDSESERKFRIALRKIKEDRTLITIAHRYSTIAEINRVIEIENGEIIYNGPTSQWLSKSVSS